MHRLCSSTSYLTQYNNLSLATVILVTSHKIFYQQLAGNKTVIYPCIPVPEQVPGTQQPLENMLAV